MHQFGNDTLSARVSPDGAEPTSLRFNGRELLWQAGPEWPRHAPVLFPIVGRLPDDTLRHDGGAFRMTQHGFARDRRFRWLERGPQGCALLLEQDEDSLRSFPFPFALGIEYRLQGTRLLVEYAVRNPGAAALPFSIGAHPAFRWPLADGIDQRAHRLVFEREEPAPIRRVSGGLLRPDALPSPVRGRVLPLDPALFEDDAVILDRPESRAVRFEAEGAPLSLTVRWHGMRQLGLWSKPGAEFLCIEPWRGLASPAGFDGCFEDKPELVRLDPGGEARFGWSVQAAA